MDHKFGFVDITVGAFVDITGIMAGAEYNSTLDFVVATYPVSQKTSDWGHSSRLWVIKVDED